MNIPAELRYTTSHEWARLEADGSVTVGITDHAQELLGDLVFVELPEADKALAAGENAAVLESVKAAADVYAPVSGKVAARNEALSDAPEQINQDAYAAWLFRLVPANPAEFGQLLDAAGYKALVNAET
ncbi:MAG: glycine cleavage system protein GcvH [Zoogloeaceae bacterium]|jgi:glycine cleavage system H protein|nr:glycine cleavage system protein GcvH [Zoogloeaceae bacterium]